MDLGFPWTSETSSYNICHPSLCSCNIFKSSKFTITNKQTNNSQNIVHGIVLILLCCYDQVEDHFYGCGTISGVHVDWSGCHLELEMTASRKHFFRIVNTHSVFSKGWRYSLQTKHSVKSHVPANGWILTILGAMKVTVVIVVGILLPLILRVESHTSNSTCIVGYSHHLWKRGE